MTARIGLGPINPGDSPAERALKQIPPGKQGIHYDWEASCLEVMKPEPEDPEEPMQQKQKEPGKLRRLLKRIDDWWGNLTGR